MAATDCRGALQASHPSAAGVYYPVRKSNRLDLPSQKGAVVGSFTIATHERLRLLTKKPMHEMLASALEEAMLSEKIDVHAYCFMLNRVHLLVRGQTDRSDLLSFIKRFKIPRPSRCGLEA